MHAHQDVLRDVPRAQPRQEQDGACASRRAPRAARVARRVEHRAAPRRAAARVARRRMARGARRDAPRRVVWFQLEGVNDGSMIRRCSSAMCRSTTILSSRSRRRRRPRDSAARPRPARPPAVWCAPRRACYDVLWRAMTRYVTAPNAFGGAPRRGVDGRYSARGQSYVLYCTVLCCTVL